ncbi:MAG: hypothetical protein ACP5MG_06855 [Verrucomicrobiia bacterium]
METIDFSVTAAFCEVATPPVGSWARSKAAVAVKAAVEKNKIPT